MTVSHGKTAVGCWDQQQEEERRGRSVQPFHFATRRTIGCSRAQQWQSIWARAKCAGFVYRMHVLAALPLAASFNYSQFNWTNCTKPEVEINFCKWIRMALSDTEAVDKWGKKSIRQSRTLIGSHVCLVKRNHRRANLVTESVGNKPHSYLACRNICSAAAFLLPRDVLAMALCPSVRHKSAFY